MYFLVIIRGKGWLDREKKAFGGMHLYSLRTQENDLNCLGEILAAFEFDYVLRSTFLEALLFLTLGDFVRFNGQSGTKTLMRGERGLYLPIHPHARLLVRLFLVLLPSIPVTNQPHLAYSFKLEGRLKEPHPAKENPHLKRRQPIGQRVVFLRNKAERPKDDLHTVEWII